MAYAVKIGPAGQQGDADIAITQSKDFLCAMFGDSEVAWVAAVKDGKAADWFGERGISRVADVARAGADVYFSQGRIAATENSRKAAGVDLHVMVAIDDVGSKVSLRQWDDLFTQGCPRPCAIVETSPGNFQYFWRFSQPIAAVDDTAVANLQHFRALLAEAGLTDAATTDDPHYFRLGCGHNSKDKHRKANGGVAPPVRYTEFELSRSVTLNELAIGVFGQSWRSLPLKGGVVKNGVKLTTAACTAAMSDPLVIMAEDIGLRPVPRGNGKIDALCPNMAAHTHDGREESGFAFLADGMSACQHASCQTMKSPDFARMIEGMFDAEMATLKAKGQPVRDVNAEALRHRLGAEFFSANPIDPSQLPLLNSVVSSTAASNAGSGEAKTPRKSPHIAAIEMLTAAGIDAFCDEIGKVWVWLNGKMLCLSSPSGFRPMLGWLSDRGLDLVGAARANLVETLQARASTKPSRHVRFRIANGGTLSAPVVYINLMDPKGRGVKVDLNGWEVANVKDFPMDLADRQGSLPMPVLLRANDAVSFFDRLERHFPLPPIINPNDPADVGVQVRAATLTFLMGQFYRTGTVPHLALAGEQGGGKTTAARRLVSLTDPDVDEARPSLPANPTEIFALVAQRSNFVLDNISGVKPEHADILCVLATGGTHSTRSLYTDDGRALMRAKTSVIVTSVLPDGITKRPDLIDRMLLVQIQPLPKGKRRAEGELDAAWEADRPYLLAGLLDLLSVAVKNVSSIRAAQGLGLLPSPPRIADVAQVAEAAAWHGLGWQEGLCTNALNAMRSEAAQDHLTDDPFAFRLRELLRQQKDGVWTGSYRELEAALGCIDGPDWGDRRAQIKSRHARVKGPLRDLWGISGEAAGRKSSARIYEFRLTSGRAL